MVYVIKDAKVIQEDGTIVTVSGIVKAVKSKNGLLDVNVITNDMDEFNGTIEECFCKKASIADIVSVMLDEVCESDKDAISKLTERFEELYDEMEDGQEAFDYLMEEEMNDMLEDFDFVYSVTGENWGITVENFNDSILNEVNKLYDENAKNMEEACAVVEHQVEKTMSNVGCDPYTALRLEKEDDLPDCFQVKAESDRVYIELLDM